MKFVQLSVIFLFLLGPKLYAKEVVDKVIASVGDEIILLSELQNMQVRAKKAGGIDETLLLGESADTIKTDKKAQLNYLIREKLVESEVKRLNLTATDEQVNAELSQMSKRSQMSLPEFTNYMATQGYKLDEYKQILKSRIERQTFFEKEIISKLRITDDDAFGVFQTKYPKYRPSVGEFKIAQIFFAAKTGSGEEALARAKAALARINNGESYEAVANQVDETPGSNKDGVLGVFRSGEFLPEIEAAISNLSPNSVSGIIKGPSGYHIVKLLSKKTILDPNFLKVKENIKAGLVQQNFERQLKNWFELKKIDANIKIYDEAL
jgi:peptidyl-prolyl cis-trans isomerase SurA